MNEYQPQKRGEKTDRNVFRNLWIWAPITLFCGLIACICLSEYQATLPKTYLAKDPYGQIRSTFETIIHLFLIIGSGTALLFIYDWKTDGNLFRGILWSPLGCAIFASVLFLGVCLLGCYV